MYIHFNACDICVGKSRRHGVVVVVGGGCGSGGIRTANYILL